MSLKVTQTSIPIDFNHQTDPNLIKTINLAPYSLNNLGHFKIEKEGNIYMIYMLIIEIGFALLHSKYWHNFTTNFNQIHICHSGMLIRGIN